MVVHGGGAETTEQPGECRGHAAGAGGTCLARVSIVEGGVAGERQQWGIGLWEGCRQRLNLRHSVWSTRLVVLRTSYSIALFGVPDVTTGACWM